MEGNRINRVITQRNEAPMCKCPWCRKIDSVANMVEVTRKGKPTGDYYHRDCWDALKDFVSGWECE